MPTRAETLGPAKVNAVLTNIVKGYHEPSYTGHLISPTVFVDSDGGKVRQFGKEYFNHMDTKRGLRSKSARASVAGSELVAYKLAQKSMETPLDDEELRNGEEIDIQTRAAKTSTNAVLLDSEIELATLLQATSSYSSGMYTTLTSGSELNDPDVDPIKFLNGLRSPIRKKIGRNPNTLVLSPDTEEAILEHPLVIARLSTSDLKISTREQLAKMLKFENIIVPESIYNDEDGELTDIYSEYVGAYYIAPESERSTENPSYIYTLRLTGQDPVIIEDYRDETIQSTIYRAKLNEQFFISTKDAGYLVKNTLA